MTVGDTEPRAILQKIFSLDLWQCNLEVCLASAQPDNTVPTFRRIHMSQRMADMFREAIVSALEPFKKGTQDRDIVLHDFTVDTVKPEHEIEHLDLSDYDTITRQIAPLAQYQGMSHFEDRDRVFVERLHFHVILVQPRQGQPVYFFRKYTHTQLLSESPHFAMRLLDKDLYDHVSEPTYLFDRHVDCISCGDNMFILQKNNFYAIFNFIEELEKVAKQTLELLRQKDLIYNFDRFAHDCEQDQNKILKLKNISMQPYLNTITIEDLERTIQQYDLKVPVVTVGGKKKVQYESKDRWGILNLLDDVYLDSAMTSASYFAKGKRGLRKK